jgi:hypothetical protein
MKLSVKLFYDLFPFFSGCFPPDSQVRPVIIRYSGRSSPGKEGEPDLPVRAWLKKQVSKKRERTKRLALVPSVSVFWEAFMT